MRKYLIITAIFVGAIIVSFIGYKLLEQDKKQPSSLSPPPAALDLPAPSLPDTDISRDTMPIPELGITIELPKSIENTVHQYDAQFNAQNPDLRQVSISSHELIEASQGSCSPSLSTAPIGTLTKTSNPEQTMGQSLSPDNINVFLVKDYYYIFKAPSAPCSTDPAVDAIANQQRPIFMEALQKTMQALE